MPKVMTQLQVEEGLRSLKGRSGGSGLVRNLGVALGGYKDINPVLDRQIAAFNEARLKFEGEVTKGHSGNSDWRKLVAVGAEVARLLDYVAAARRATEQ
jgi:hypothetical protein